MFQAFGHNRVVCMDATHGTNAYRFHLITLFVVDDFGEGMPVAWCISNREDEHAIAHFLEEVHRNGDNGAVQPQWFMSDDAGQYYNACFWSPTPQAIVQLACRESMANTTEKSR